MTESRLGIVILAAGEARRFGACKQLALFHTKPLLQHVIDAAPLSDLRLVVMTGKYHEAIAAAKDEGVVTGAELIHNPDWSSGMSSSIRLGCELLADDCDQLLVLLADQVLVSTSELETLSHKLWTVERLRGLQRDCRPTCRILTRLVSRSADTQC